MPWCVCVQDEGKGDEGKEDGEGNAGDDAIDDAFEGDPMNTWNVD